MPYHYLLFITVIHFKLPDTILESGGILWDILLRRERDSMPTNHIHLRECQRAIVVAGHIGATVQITITMCLALGKIINFNNASFIIASNIHLSFSTLNFFYEEHDYITILLSSYVVTSGSDWRVPISIGFRPIVNKQSF